VSDPLGALFQEAYINCRLLPTD